MSRFRFIDLYAGIGGFRRPLESIGGQCVFTSESNPFAQQTYAANHTGDEWSQLTGDIEPYLQALDLIPAHDVLVAGFPCQPFSQGGTAILRSLGRPDGFDCPTRGTAFHTIASILAHHQSPVALLENVPNLERHDKGRTFKTITTVLGELGYQLHHRVIDAAAWVPQKRKRLFMVAFRDATDFDFDDMVIPTDRPVLASVLEDHVDERFTLSEKLWTYLQRHKEKHRARGNGYGCSVFGPDDVANTLTARYYKDGAEILIEQPGTRPRRLTPRECARLMGFETADRPFIIPVSNTQAYKQLGNAVVVPVVGSLAGALQPHICKAARQRSAAPIAA